MDRIGKAVRKFVRGEDGAALAEYGILIAFHRYRGDSRGGVSLQIYRSSRSSPSTATP